VLQADVGHAPHDGAVQRHLQQQAHRSACGSAKTMTSWLASDFWPPAAGRGALVNCWWGGMLHAAGKLQAGCRGACRESHAASYTSGCSIAPGPQLPWPLLRAPTCSPGRTITCWPSCTAAASTSSAVAVFGAPELSSCVAGSSSRA
jgi:hypothetical protein